MKKEIEYYAFFDVDETIISIKSMFSFLEYYYTHNSKNKFLGNLQYRRILIKLKILSVIGKPRDYINASFYRAFANCDTSTLKKLGESWHWSCLGKVENFYNQAVLNEIIFHKMQGAKIVLVSGSFLPCLEPIAKYINADNILATCLEIVGDKYSGKILNFPNIGQGKAKAIKEYLELIGYGHYSNCYAYGDHVSDLPMLSLVGNPVVIPNCQHLLAFATEKKWRIMGRC